MRVIVKTESPSISIIGKIDAAFEKLVDYLAYFPAVLVIFLMFSTSAEVLGRKFLGITIDWSLEVSEHSLLFITFACAAWLLKSDRHVKADMVLSNLSSRGQRFLNVITSIIGGILCLGLSYWAGIKTIDSIQRNI